MRVLVNSNRKTCIELSRTEKYARCLMTLDNVSRDIRKLPLIKKELKGFGENKIWVETRFDKEWVPVLHNNELYPVRTAIFKALNNKYIPLTERARKELVMALIISELKVIDSGQDAHNLLTKAPENSSFIEKPEDLVEAFNPQELGTIYKSLGAEDGEEMVEKLKKNSSFIACLGVAKKIFTKVEETLVKEPAPVKKVLKSSRKSLEERNPVTVALLNALKVGGTKTEVLSNAEKSLTGKAEPSNSLRATLTYILPALLLAGVVEQVDEFFRFK